MLLITHLTGKVSCLLFLLQELVKRLHRAHLHIHRRALSSPLRIILEYIHHMVRLNKHLSRIIVICHNLVGISLVHNFFKFRIGNLLYHASLIAGDIKKKEKYGNQHVQPAQVRAGNINLGLIIIHIITHHYSLLLITILADPAFQKRLPPPHSQSKSGISVNFASAHKCSS